MSFNNQPAHCILQLILNRSEEKRRYLLKISAKPGAVAVTANSQLIVGSTRGHVVVFNLSLLTPPEGELCHSNMTSTSLSFICAKYENVGIG